MPNTTREEEMALAATTVGRVPVQEPQTPARGPTPIPVPPGNAESHDRAFGNDKGN